MDDFGGKLRRARERRGISLRQVAASTKISAAALEALERNDVSKLPGGIFTRAFVRSYAIETGLDPDETVREFVERFHQEPPPSTEAIAAALPEQERAFQQQRRKAARALTIAGVSLVVVLGAAFFVLRNRAKQAVPVAKVAAVPESPPPAAAAQPAVKLDIHPTSACWVSLTVDGTKVFARVMQPGEHESHTVERDVVVEVGDAGAFAFSVDGRPGKPVGDAGQVATLRMTPATAAEYVR